MDVRNLDRALELGREVKGLSKLLGDVLDVDGRNVNPNKKLSHMLCILDNSDFGQELITHREWTYIMSQIIVGLNTKIERNKKEIEAL